MYRLHSSLWDVTRLSLSALGLSLSLGAFCAELQGKVTAIADGDTLSVLDNLQVLHRVRVSGIDAPERRQPHSDKAKAHLSQLLYGKSVEVHWTKRDQHGRIIGLVLVDGTDAGLAQIRAGYAWFFHRYERELSVENRERYAAAELEARRQKRGLWAEPGPVKPWDFRASKIDRTKL